MSFFLFFLLQLEINKVIKLYLLSKKFFFQTFFERICVTLLSSILLHIIKILA